MNKRDIILFGVGFFVSYFLFKVTNNRKSKALFDNEVSDKFNQTIPPKELGRMSDEVKEFKKYDMSVDPRIEPCKEKWIRFSQTVKFTSDEQKQSTYNNYMNTCVAQS